MATHKTRALTIARRPSALRIASIEKSIYIFRGLKVMVDADLARLYHVPTSRLNEQVKLTVAAFRGTSCSS